MNKKIAAPAKLPTPRRKRGRYKMGGRVSKEYADMILGEIQRAHLEGKVAVKP